MMGYKLVLLFFASILATGFVESFGSSNKRQVVLYWGQGTSRIPENSLDHFCNLGKYDVIVVSYITKFFADPTTRFPGMNLAVHCGVIQNPAYPALFSCGGIGNAILKCQRKGIKVLLGIRDEKTKGKEKEFLQSEKDAARFAKKIWNLFLGGKESASLRPFGDAVMDGINLSIQTGTDEYYGDMLGEFMGLFAVNRARTYIVTASPSCGLPVSDFKTVFHTHPEYFDAIYLQHDYNANCHPRGSNFDANLNQWASKIRTMNGISFKDTKLYLTIVLNLELEFYMTLWSEFKPIYENKLKDMPEFGGICLSDAGWDEHQLVKPEHKRYSELAHDLFNPVHLRTTPRSTTRGSTTPEPLNLKIGAIWGSNIAEDTIGNMEPALRLVCERTLYDTIIVNTLVDTADVDNKGNLPSLDFSKHCRQPFSSKYKTYFRCNTIGSAIHYCQRKGIKVLLNIGGLNSKHISFSNKSDSEYFAGMLWKLFLGGVTESVEEKLPRSFGSVVLDGINIEARTGDKKFFVDFVRELRRLMDNNNDRQKYLITANPSCKSPNSILDESFSKEISAFDHLFVSFDDPQCNVNVQDKFAPVFQSWYDYALKAGGPKIWVGLSADPRHITIGNSLQYLARVKAKDKLEKLAESYPSFGGVLINDASWDFENRINDVQYSQFLANILRPGRVPGRNDAVTTVIPAPGETTTTATTKKKPRVTNKVDDGDKKDDVGVTEKTTTEEKVLVRYYGGSPTSQVNIITLIFSITVCLIVNFVKQ